MGEEESNGLGHIDELDEGEDLEVVQFTTEDGKEYTAAILAVIEHEGSDYAVLAPLDQLQDDDGEELELFLFEYGEDEEGGEFFSYIEDEAIFNAVREAAAVLLDDPAAEA